MTPEEFVDAVQEFVIKPTALGNVECFLHPPGRRPAEALLALSHWFKGLQDHDRDMVTRAMAMSARDAVFGLFVAIDGGRKLTDEDGHFELRYVRGDQVDILSDKETGWLHELLE